MLQVAEDPRPTGGRIEGDFEAVDGWSVMPIDPTTRQLRIFLGDPVGGPLVWLFDGAPLDAEAQVARAEMLSKFDVRHLHRTPTFRIAIGEQPRQMLLNNSWYGSGEYFLLDANRIYTDPNGVDGFQTLLVFADRRGMHPVRKDATAAMGSDELIAHHEQRFASFGSGLASLHLRDEDAVGGIAISTHDAIEYGQARGSLADRSGWSALSDGSRIAAAFMGDAAGPVVVLSENAPGAVESPTGVCAADMLRVIISGSCSMGGRRYEAGSFVATEAGAAIEAIVHGPEGSMQLLVVSDRRALAPLDERCAPVISGRLGELARTRPARQLERPA